MILKIAVETTDFADNTDKEGIAGPGVFPRRVAAKDVLDHDEAHSHPCHPCHPWFLFRLNRAGAGVMQVSVLTIDTIFRLRSHGHFVLRQCRQDFGGVAGQERCGGQVAAGEAAVHRSGKTEFLFRIGPRHQRFGGWALKRLSGRKEAGKRVRPEIGPASKLSQFRPTDGPNPRLTHQRYPLPEKTNSPNATAKGTLIMAADKPKNGA
jgi:hypothetical protein